MDALEIVKKNIDDGRLALAVGDNIQAARCFELAARVARPGQADPNGRHLEKFRFEALRLWGTTLTPFEQAAHLTQVLVEAENSRTEAGREILFDLNCEIGEALAQVGGWRDALASFENAYRLAVQNNEVLEIERATKLISFAKSNLN